MQRSVLQWSSLLRSTTKYRIASPRMSSAPDSVIKPAKAMQNVPENIWVEINKAVTHYKPVNLGQGFPDFAPPSHLLENLVDVCHDSNVLLHQYTRSMGHLRLVNILAKMYKPFTVCTAQSIPKELVSATFQPDCELNPLENIIVSTGAYGSLWAAFAATVNPGDECIVMEPSFDCYLPMIERNGGVPVLVQLKMTNGDSSADWKLDMADLEKKITSKTRMLVLNTPHNPLGKVFNRQELEALAAICVKHNLLCISDEVYEWLVFGNNGDKHLKIASLPGMWSRTITIGSAGKTFSVTGWKLGWSIGPKELILAMQAYQQNTIYTCATPLQEAVARSLELEWTFFNSPEKRHQCYLESLRHEMNAKSEQMVTCLKEKGLHPVRPQSGYFLVSDISSVNVPNDGEYKNLLKDVRTNLWLMKEKGVSGIPLSVFYSARTKSFGENYLRWCFSKSEETLKKAFDVFKKASF